MALAGSDLPEIERTVEARSAALKAIEQPMELSLAASLADRWRKSQRHNCCQHDRALQGSGTAALRSRAPGQLPGWGLISRVE